jgi:hypothetical protein
VAGKEDPDHKLQPSSGEHWRVSVLKRRHCVLGTSTFITRDLAPTVVVTTTTQWLPVQVAGNTLPVQVVPPVQQG